MTIADTYNSEKTISEQLAAREASMIAEDKYFESAGVIDRPLPDNWPWPIIKNRLATDDKEDALVKTDVASNTSAISSLTGRVDSLESSIG